MPDMKTLLERAYICCLNFSVICEGKPAEPCLGKPALVERGWARSPEVSSNL